MTDKSSSFEKRNIFNDSQSDQLSDFILDDGNVIYKQALPRCMINPNSVFKSTWNIIILNFVVFQAIVIPPRIAFEEEISDAWLWTDNIIDIFFMVDIFINFSCAIEDESGDLIINRKKIALRYLQGWFVLDLASCFPITIIQQIMGISTAKGNTSKFVKLVKIPRIFRIIRLVKIFKLLNKSKEIGAFVD